MTRMFARASLVAFLGLTLTAGIPYIVGSGGSLAGSAIIDTMSQSELSAGDRFMAARQFGSAEQAYRVAAIFAREQGRLPVEEMRRLANARFFQGDHAGASSVLMQLADEAATSGDRAAEFWATADAAWMARLAGDRYLYRELSGRAEDLLDALGLEGPRRSLSETLVDPDLRVPAPHLSSW